MIKYLKQFTYLTVTAFAVTLFLACESKFKDAQKMHISEFSPSGDADKVNLQYTDSGFVKSVLLSDKMLDYATVAYPFTEFPKKVNFTLFDKNGKKTFILADYAISYKATNMIDLQGNVSIKSEDGQMLETEQLYFDQKNEWFFTERKFKFTDPKGISMGQGIDFSKDFKVVNSQRINGIIDSE